MLHVGKTDKNFDGVSRLSRKGLDIGIVAVVDLRQANSFKETFSEPQTGIESPPMRIIFCDNTNFLDIQDLCARLLSFIDITIIL